MNDIPICNVVKNSHEKQAEMMKMKCLPYKINDVTGFSWHSCQRILSEILKVKYFSVKSLLYLLPKDKGKTKFAALWFEGKFEMTVIFFSKLWPSTSQEIYPFIFL